MNQTITVRVEVTEEHIERGARHSLCFCPVALALKDSKLKDENISVSSSGVSFRNRRSLGYFGFPSEVQQRIERFDDVGEMEPFAFDLELPTEVLQDVTP